MKIYDIAFYAASFFIVGVLLYNFKLSFLIVVLVAALLVVLFLLVRHLKIDGIINYTNGEGNGSPESKLFWLAGLSLIIILGTFYAGTWEIYQYKKINIPFDQSADFSGVVVQNPERGASQKLVVGLQPPYAGRILVNLRPYPEFSYGDLIDFKGAIKKPEERSVNYYAKDGIFGIIAFPKADLISQGNGSAIKAGLFKLKNKITANFAKVLPPERAAFLSGITLGERSEFSKEFKEAMSKSGTTHLVALSGYNVSILAWAVAGFFSWFFRRRWMFFLSILFILGFVLTTGAEVSVVRAAIMGSILLLAGQVGRVYSSRNAIILAAFFMVLVNPKILNFDISFQLSFLALLGIVYLAPVVKHFLELKDDPGFLSWRENGIATLSAQLMVAPLLISSFSNFSLVSLLANVLILGFIPATMAWGFLLGFSDFISYHFSIILGWFLNILLSYEIFVINFFCRFEGLRLEGLSPWFATIYYLLIILFIIRGLRKTKTFWYN